MNPTCKLCGKSAFSRIIHVNCANFSSNIKKYDILQCNHCNLSTIHPFPTYSDIEEIYIEEGTFSTPYVNPYQDSVFFQILEPLYRKYGSDEHYIVRQCSRLVSRKNKRVLDIGCSTGGLLNAFHLIDPGMELSGVDIDPNAKKNAIPFLQDRIIIGDFISHEMNFEEKFDIVTMRFVIEHLLDFKGYVAKAVRLLNPGGVLFISTPDIDSPNAKLLKDKWKLINDPEQKIGHVHWFNRKSIEYLATEFGLRIEKCINRGALIYHLPVTVQNLLRKTFGTDPLSGRFIKYYTPRIIYAIVFDGLLSQVFSYGECIYAFMRKGSEE